jgi:hypothetical protein
LPGHSAVPSPVFVGATPSPFFGDYRAAGVVSLGLDVNVFSASIGVDHSRSVSLSFSDPGIFWYFQIWDVGIDSIRITSSSH